MTNPPERADRAFLYEQLSQALTDRDIGRFKTIAFVNRHAILAALAFAPPAASSAVCRTCAGEGWVCESHRDHPWGGGDGCCGGAGSPCSSSNLETACAGFATPPKPAVDAEREAYERAAKVAESHPVNELDERPVSDLIAETLCEHGARIATAIRALITPPTDPVGVGEGELEPRDYDGSIGWTSI